MSFMALIDFFSVLPFYIEKIIEAVGAANNVPSGAIMTLRIVRVLRIFKLTRRNQTLADFFQAMSSIAWDLGMFGCVLATCTVLISTAMYFVEKDGPQAENFANIPRTMYWCIITFTTVGYGDMYPESDAGRAIAAFAAVLGVFLMNVPIAFVLISFDEVYTTRKARESRMKRVVDKLFSWRNRHVKKDPEVTVANRPGKNAAVRRLSSVVRIKTKRDGARAKRFEKQQREKLLHILMNPIAGRRVLQYEAEKWHDEQTEKQNATALKYGIRWMAKCGILTAKERLALHKKSRNKKQQGNRVEPDPNPHLQTTTI